jgi:hypothetical protein
MRTVLLTPLTLLIAGCSAGWRLGAPAPLAEPADESEYAGVERSGPLELRGQAFVVTADGGVKLAAGRVVTLDPATRYARRWFRRYGAESWRQELSANDSMFREVRLKTVADAEGRFRFAGVAPGTYLVRSVVTWREPEDSVIQGGAVAALVRVGQEGDADEPNEVMLRQVMTADSAAILVTEIVSDAELLGRPHRLLAHVRGEACLPGLETAESSEEEARKELALKASRRGADAVAHPVCRKRGASLLGCLARIVCEGDAVGWR